VRAVARAEPSTVVTGLTDGYTTQVGADTQHDQPLRPLDALGVGLRVAELRKVHPVGLFDLFGSAVADEDGLATPFDDDLDRGCNALECGVADGADGDGGGAVRSCPPG
jgi:hypothetical protein